MGGGRGQHCRLVGRVRLRGNRGRGDKREGCTRQGRPRCLQNMWAQEGGEETAVGRVVAGSGGWSPMLEPWRCIRPWSFRMEVRRVSGIFSAVSVLMMARQARAEACRFDAGNSLFLNPTPSALQEMTWDTLVSRPKNGIFAFGCVEVHDIHKSTLTSTPCVSPQPVAAANTPHPLSPISFARGVTCEEPCSNIPRPPGNKTPLAQATNSFERFRQTATLRSRHVGFEK